MPDLELADAGEGHAQVHGNYFGDNAGAGIELLQLQDRPGDYSTGNDISDNTFYNNGSAATSQNGQIAIYNDAGLTPPGANIHDNGYNATTNGFISNVNSDPDLTSWSDMTDYTASTNTWSGLGGSSINAFQLLPGNGQTNDAWVAREWIAPSAGTVVIHGRVFKDDVSDGGDGVLVLIAQNGVAQWPTNPDYLTYRTVDATDQSGYDTDLTLAVNAGDVIRFVVNSGVNSDNTGDLTSWSPSISYVG